MTNKRGIEKRMLLAERYGTDDIQGVINQSTKDIGHTPGPWEIFPKYDTYPDLAFGIWGENNDYLVCSSTDGGKQAEANARLIAAAPEMLGALQTILPMAQDWAYGSDIACELNSVELIEKAINKATQGASEVKGVE